MTWLKRLPAYLQAITRRLSNSSDGISRQQQRDLESVQDLEVQLYQLSEQPGVDWQAVDDIRWMIEEFRVSCFAKPMKAAFPVSEKRILAAMAQAGS